MKTLLSLFLVLMAVSAGLVNLSSECPQQYVPSSNSICIQPNYLPGCDIYKT